MYVDNFSVLRSYADIENYKFHVMKTLMDITRPIRGDVLYDAETVMIVMQTSEYGYLVGLSHCHPSDAFNYKLGRHIAAGRVMKMIQIYGSNFPDKLCIFGEPCALRQQEVINCIKYLRNKI